MCVPATSKSTILGYVKTFISVTVELLQQQAIQISFISNTQLLTFQSGSISEIKYAKTVQNRAIVTTEYINRNSHSIYLFVSVYFQ